MSKCLSYGVGDIVKMQNLINVNLGLMTYEIVKNLIF